MDNGKWKMNNGKWKMDNSPVGATEHRRGA